MYVLGGITMAHDRNHRTTHDVKKRIKILVHFKNSLDDLQPVEIFDLIHASLLFQIACGEYRHFLKVASTFQLWINCSFLFCLHQGSTQECRRGGGQLGQVSILHIHTI